MNRVIGRTMTGSTFFRMLAGIGLASALAACAADSNVRRMNNTVTQMPVGEPGDISAMTLARAMTRVGFTREEILEFGPGIRRSLATSGGAQARRADELVALFSHMQGRIYVTSGNTGTFVVDA